MLSDRVALQPVLRVYDTAIRPVEIPETIPVDEPMVATEVLLLLHMPPGVASESVVVVPAHKLVAPVIAAGTGFTVNVTPEVQPVLSV